jgi:hypothetical protein
LVHACRWDAGSPVNQTGAERIAQLVAEMSDSERNDGLSGSTEVGRFKLVIALATEAHVNC